MQETLQLPHDFGRASAVKRIGEYLRTALKKRKLLDILRKWYPGNLPADTREGKQSLYLKEAIRNRCRPARKAAEEVNMGGELLQEFFETSADINADDAKWCIERSE